MEYLFGRRKTPAEMLRQNQRALNKAMRELDRERSRLEMQEKKIIAEIKKMARMGQVVRGLLFIVFSWANRVCILRWIYDRRYVHYVTRSCNF